jgi:hypothetical protein
MATIARITSNQTPISLSILRGRHDFIPREIRPLGVPEDSRLRSLRDRGADARLPQRPRTCHVSQALIEPSQLPPATEEQVRSHAAALVDLAHRTRHQ